MTNHQNDTLICQRTVVLIQVKHGFFRRVTMRSAFAIKIRAQKIRTFPGPDSGRGSSYTPILYISMLLFAYELNIVSAWVDKFKF